MSADRTPEQAYAAALVAVQAELPRIVKGQHANTGSYGYDYADLTAISDDLLPILSKHGLAFTAQPKIADGAFVLDYALLHSDAHREGGLYPLPDPAKSSAQQIGSAITYARRYTLCAITGVAPGGDDDDGRQASDARSAPSQPASPERPRTIKDDIADAAGSLGMPVSDIAADYHRRYGTEVKAATDDDLRLYLSELRQEASQPKPVDGVNPATGDLFDAVATSTDPGKVGPVDLTDPANHEALVAATNRLDGTVQRTTGRDADDPFLTPLTEAEQAAAETWVAEWQQQLAGCKSQAAVGRLQSSLVAEVKAGRLPAEVQRELTVQANAKGYELRQAKDSA